MINGNRHWAWVAKKQQEMVWALTNLRINMSYLEQSANKEVACGMRERNEKHDSVNSSILPNWPGANYDTKSPWCQAQGVKPVE